MRTLDVGMMEKCGVVKVIEDDATWIIKRMTLITAKKRAST
jgi:hypothetical protein